MRAASAVQGSTPWVIGLVLIGLLLWVVNTYVPMDEKIKTILNVVIVIVVILWLLSVFGLVDTLYAYRVPTAK